MPIKSFQIDEKSELIVNSDLPSLEAFAKTLKQSIAKLRRDAKKAPKVQGELFSNEAEVETVFRLSVVSQIDLFKKKFQELEQFGVDVDYYYNRVWNWSDKKTTRRTARGWIATARDFMLTDKTAGKLKYISGARPPIENDALLAYLKI